MKKLSVYLVDDHALFREGLRFLLSELDIVDKIYEAENGQQFIDGIKKQAVDVALLDIEMPLMNGIKATLMAKEICPKIKIIALSMYSDEHYYVNMIESGADGFLLKNSNFFNVKKAIEEVAKGKNYFSHEIVQLLIKRCKRNESINIDLQITEREAEILNLICLGLSNVEIAEELKISKRTVDKHRQNLLDKTNSRNTVVLVLYAIKNGLFQF